MQVTVFNTVGTNEQTVEFNGSTWGELQSALTEAGVVYAGMSAVVGETQVTLESNQAQTPSESFSLFLLPVEVKSGNFNDDDFNDDDNDDNDGGGDNGYTAPVLSAETQLMINKLEQANSLNNEIISILKGRAITDPRILSQIAKAESIKANFRKG